MFAAASFAVAFAYIFVSAPLVHAADADWKGEAIVYGSNQYSSIGESKGTESHNIPKGSRVYSYVEPAQDGANNPTSKAHLIYFAPGTDPTKATTANVVTYDFVPPDNYSGTPTAKTISLTPQAESGAQSETTSCVVEGIGWIVCPITNFLAEAMDWLFGILANFLAVRPVQTNQDNSLFRAWSIMRDFANVAFVVGFLVIIYSQISNLGLSNYGIKRTLPRLIIAAILVNISYWICAVAIDLSNIIGYSLEDIFMGMRNQITSTEHNGWDVVSWKSAATAILSGGTVAAAGITALVSIGSLTGAIYMLLPVLVGVLIAALVAIIIMAARQALITILVILAPLAFVAFLLPNTEKYFDRWKDIFVTMLMLFPIFSILFGGSQVAGIAIIQNADSIVMMILGMAVQIAPLVVLPFLIKFSGSLLGRIAGMVNDKSKGLMDRTSNFAKDQAAFRKSQVLARDDLRKRNALSRAVQGMDNRRRKREGWQKANESMADAKWANTNDSHAIHQASENAKMLQETGEAISQAAVERLRTTNGHGIQVRDVNLRVAKLDLDVAKSQAEVQWENMRANESRINTVPTHLSDQARQAREHTIGAAVVARQIHSAKHEQQQDFAKAMQASEALQIQAGGIAEHGADSALAAAITAKRKAYGEAVDEAHQILKHLNLSGEERQRLAIDGNVVIRDKDTGAVIKTFTPESTYAREAAIEAQMRGEGNFAQIQTIIMNSGSKLSDFKTTIGDEIAKNKLAEKGAYLGGQTINEVKQGVIKSETELNTAVARTIADGKIKPVQLATMDKDAVAKVLEVAKSGSKVGLSPQRAAALDAQIATLGRSAQDALTNPSLSGNVAQNVKPLLEDFVRNWPPPSAP